MAGSSASDTEVGDGNKYPGPAVTPYENPYADKSATNASNPNKHERIIANWTKVVGVFTGLLFVATAASVYVLYKTDHTLTATLESQKRSSEQQLRAYLVVPGARIAADDNGKFKFGVTAADGSGELLIYYDVSNEGTTPAYDVFRRITVEYPFNGQFNFNYTDGTAAYISKKVTFGPVRTRRMMPAEVDAISTGKTPLAFAGQITYRDIFNRDWATNFCFVYAAVPVEPAFVSCPRWNATDRLNYAR
jgi:hypothetical protein